MDVKTMLSSQSISFPFLLSNLCFLDVTIYYVRVANTTL
jgi:hypothetical protein